MKQINIGVIGCGVIGCEHLKAIGATPGAKLLL